MSARESHSWLTTEGGHVEQRLNLQSRKTDMQTEYWMQRLCSSISYLADYQKYEITETHTPADSELNQKQKPAHVE